MPIKLKKFYVEIPQCKQYLLSNYGEVIKKSTWKKLSVTKNQVRLTAEGKPITLSVPKLVRELLMPFNIPCNYKIQHEDKLKSVIRTKIVAERNKIVTKVERYAEYNKEHTLKSKFGRAESYLSFINNLRDEYGESKTNDLVKAQEWYNDLLRSLPKIIDEGKFIY